MAAHGMRQQALDEQSSGEVDEERAAHGRRMIEAAEGRLAGRGRRSSR